MFLMMRSYKVAEIYVQAIHCKYKQSFCEDNLDAFMGSTLDNYTLASLLLQGLHSSLHGGDFATDRLQDRCKGQRGNKTLVQALRITAIGAYTAHDGPAAL